MKLNGKNRILTRHYAVGITSLLSLFRFLMAPIITLNIPWFLLIKHIYNFMHAVTPPAPSALQMQSSSALVHSSALFFFFLGGLFVLVLLVILILVLWKFVKPVEVMKLLGRSKKWQGSKTDEFGKVNNFLN